jgi:hypothetical protein
MEVTEGYWWYQSNDDVKPTIVKIVKSRVIFTTDKYELYGWFFGNEVEESVVFLKKHGKFLKETKYNV